MTGVDRVPTTEMEVEPGPAPPEITRTQGGKGVVSPKDIVTKKREMDAC